MKQAKPSQLRMLKLEPGSVGQRFMDRYMAETFDFGGETKTRAEVYRWFEENGLPGRAADYWLLGAERTTARRPEKT